MSLADLLHLQALKLRQHVLNPRLTEAVIAATPPDQLRVIQTTVSPAMFEAVEDVCQKLDLTKRQFVEAALADAVQQAEKAINSALADLQEGR
jgi:hypothetical protein